MKSGRNGITSVKPMKPIKLAAVTANRLRRYAIADCRLPIDDRRIGDWRVPIDGVTIDDWIED